MVVVRRCVRPHDLIGSFHSHPFHLLGRCSASRGGQSVRPRDAFSMGHVQWVRVTVKRPTVSAHGRGSRRVLVDRVGHHQPRQREDSGGADGQLSRSKESEQGFRMWLGVSARLPTRGKGKWTMMLVVYLIRELLWLLRQTTNR